MKTLYNISIYLYIIQQKKEKFINIILKLFVILFIKIVIHLKCFCVFQALEVDAT